jgi:hypothetical protein
MQGKLQRNATTQVYVNSQEGRRLITKNEDIEDACIEENIARFSQSEDTPFMQEPLLSALGYLADTPAAESILQGTYKPPTELDRYTKLFINELRMPDNIRNGHQMSDEVTCKGNKRAWSRQKEQVSSEPFGLTFSHYKAASSDPINNQFDAKLRGVPYKYGFSPHKWQDITDVEI